MIGEKKACKQEMAMFFKDAQRRTLQEMAMFFKDAQRRALFEKCPKVFGVTWKRRLGNLPLYSVIAVHLC